MDIGFVNILKIINTNTQNEIVNPMKKAVIREGVSPGVVAVADDMAMAMIDQVLGSYKQALERGTKPKPKAGYYERRSPRKQPTKELTEAIKPEEKPIPVTVVLARPRRVFNFEE
jgi:hypothetical protein